MKPYSEYVRNRTPVKRNHDNRQFRGKSGQSQNIGRPRGKNPSNNKASELLKELAKLLG